MAGFGYLANSRAYGCAPDTLFRHSYLHYTVLPKTIKTSILNRKGQINHESTKTRKKKKNFVFS